MSAVATNHADRKILLVILNLPFWTYEVTGKSSVTFFYYEVIETTSFVLLVSFFGSRSLS
jgi:hypothetical protein